MKRAFLIVSIFMLSMHTAVADDTDVVCQDLGGIAKSIMDARQDGLPISNTMKAVGWVFSDPDAKKIVKAIVIEAYETPLYSAESIKERTISEFRNKIEAACLKRNLE